jgi:hypothetical protein
MTKPDVPDWSNEIGSDRSMDPEVLAVVEDEAAADEPKFGDDVHLDDEEPPT